MAVSRLSNLALIRRAWLTFEESPMLKIEFDRTIESSLPKQELWRLIRQAFEAPHQSPIWPVKLEEVETIELAQGATVTATYKVGPFEAHPSYTITKFQPDRGFSYGSDPSHPLKGGASVEVLHRPTGESALRWSGSYRARLHPLGPGAYAFVKFYFLDHFFTRLTKKLRAYEKNFDVSSRSHLYS